MLQWRSGEVRAALLQRDGDVHVLVSSDMAAQVSACESFERGDVICVMIDRVRTQSGNLRGLSFFDQLQLSRRKRTVVK